jgi:ribonuclease E
VPEPAEPEPAVPDFGGRAEPPRRRGGRAAIRSRGGDREPEPPRPREPRPAEPEPERPRPAERERARAPEPEPPRERERDRSKPHDRAGEPGYVPRRERSRPPEPGFGPEPAAGPFDWADLGPETETEADFEPAGEAGTDEAPGLPGKLEGPRRRRRRRGRRRDRERPGIAGEGAAPAAPGELEEDLEDEFDEAPTREREPEPLARGAKPAADEDELTREFDFGDEPDVHDRYQDEEGHDDLRGSEAEAEGEEAVAAEEEIDPGLEEEIRREIEEIAELEREMGLRGTTEARPRRGDEPEPGGRGAGRYTRGRGLSKPPIQEIFRRGDEVLVQVIKESIGTKGPTLSTYISIPGRYLVLMPGLNRVGVSRKIADEGQRRKLREIMTDLNPPKGLGFIVRTAGLERTKRELARDLAYLLRLWKVILRRIKKARAPAPIYQESDMITRTIRDIFTSEIDTIWIDEPQAFERAQEFLRVVMPKFVNRLKLYDERVPLFHKYGIEDEIAKIQRRRIDLPEGGSIVIDQTEALVAIDVNSGNFRVENDAERTAYEMNLRAAKEIARQLRLRDLGGVIVNDFIDMREERHRRGVEKALRDAIKRDRARTKVLRMSAFGLIEMTRQRIRPSLKRSVYEDCPNCTGAGVVKTVESMSIDVMRLLALASHREDIRRVNISVSTPVATYLNNRKRADITRLESEFRMTIHIRPEEDVPAEHLQVDCFDGNNGEIRILAPAPTGQRRPHTR